MAHTTGDYDGDGNLDLFVIGMNSFVANRLDYLNLGPPEFPEYQRMRPKMAFGNRMYFQRDSRFRQTPLSEQVARKCPTPLRQHHDVGCQGIREIGVHRFPGLLESSR